MIIHWTENPLRTIIEVDKKDIERMSMPVRNEILYDYIYLLRVYVDKNGNSYDPQKAIETLKKFSYKAIETDVQEQVNQYILALKDSHVGDCTCVPCSCTKCFAEYSLGINTIEGLGEHAANYINRAFHKEESEHSNIDEALEYLLNYKVAPYDPKSSWKNMGKEYYESWIPKWESDAKKAYSWLLNYKNTRLNSQS